VICILLRKTEKWSWCCADDV